MKNNTKSWVFFAENDMKMVESAINESRLTGQVVYHSQQAIEKYRTFAGRTNSKH